MMNDIAAKTESYSSIDIRSKNIITHYIQYYINSPYFPVLQRLFASYLCPMSPKIFSIVLIHVDSRDASDQKIRNFRLFLISELSVMGVLLF